MANGGRPPKLWDVVSKIVEDRRKERWINPSWVATEAMVALDPKRKTEPLIYLGCHMHLRQIARSLCRTRFEGDRKSAQQHEMFPGLQWRYPTARSANKDEPEYVRLDFMTAADAQYNIERLTAEGEAKLEHAEALKSFARKFAQRTHRNAA